MRVDYHLGPISISAEGDTPADVFEQLAVLQEVFQEAGRLCPRCKSDKHTISFVVRTDDEANKYYELHCDNPSCKAKLPFGCHKKPKGGLFPKRRDEDKKIRGENGWVKWDHERKVEF